MTLAQHLRRAKELRAAGHDGIGDQHEKLAKAIGARDADAGPSHRGPRCATGRDLERA